MTNALEHNEKENEFDLDSCWYIRCGSTIVHTHLCKPDASLCHVLILVVDTIAPRLDRHKDNNIFLFRRWLRV